MKTTKDVNSTVSEPRTVASPVIEPPSVPAITASTLPLSSEQYMYFTERDIDRILENLDGLRERVFPKLHGEDALDALHAQHFPSVCLIGLGRCGSNIALDVASLVYNARRFYLNEFSNQEKSGSEQRPAGWLRSNLRLAGSRAAKPVFLIEPLVMLGDLDKDIEGRIRFSRKAETSGFLDDYSKMKIMDLSEVHAGGAGNAPILGQYLAKIILNKDTQRFSNADWKFIHSYLIDSCGIKANQSRLYFYIFSAGIDIGETIRLDANDLFMSLAGPVAVAYAESVVAEQAAPAPTDKFKVFEKEQPKLNIDDLFFRSIDLPHFNKATQAIEGISLLPIEAKRYRAALEQYKKSNYDASALSDLHFFKNCSSVVSIVSLPKDYKLSYMDLNRLKTHLNSLFPNTTLKRYALVIGASANLSLTTLIVKSPCLSDDFLTLIVAFIKRCFARDQYRYDESLDNAMLDFIVSEDFDEARIEAMLNEYENPAKILDTNWYAIKPMYEKKYRELIHDQDKFVSINDIRLSRDSVKKAIKYLREIYRHRVGKTRVISLNDYDGHKA